MVDLGVKTGRLGQPRHASRRGSPHFSDDVLEDRALAQITHDDLVKLNDCFERVPGATLLRSPKQQDMYIHEIVEEYEALIAENEARRQAAAAARV